VTAQYKTFKGMANMPVINGKRLVMGCHGVFGEDLKNACLLKKRDFRNKMIIYLDASLLNFILGRNPGINTPF
jgi:hypothetical protein